MSIKREIFSLVLILFSLVFLNGKEEIDPELKKATREILDRIEKRLKGKVVLSADYIIINPFSKAVLIKEFNLRTKLGEVSFSSSRVIISPYKKGRIDEIIFEDGVLSLDFSKPFLNKKLYKGIPLIKIKRVRGDIKKLKLGLRDCNIVSLRNIKLFLKNIVTSPIRGSVSIKGESLSLFEENYTLGYIDLDFKEDRVALSGRLKRDGLGDYQFNGSIKIKDYSISDIEIEVKGEGDILGIDSGIGVKIKDLLLKIKGDLKKRLFIKSSGEIVSLLRLDKEEGKKNSCIRLREIGEYQGEIVLKDKKYKVRVVERRGKVRYYFKPKISKRALRGIIFEKNITNR